MMPQDSGDEVGAPLVENLRPSHGILSWFKDWQGLSYIKCVCGWTTTHEIKDRYTQELQLQELQKHVVDSWK